ncbi:acetylglutamate kinase [Chromatiales bacterium (ex Bugula neritina AB1)]|nr:acetylglutamate kinase [Chromatiales bacterium (ex Bugula neritina AB1)]
MYIIKIGGGEKINIEGIVSDLAATEKPFIIVHGANALRDQIAEKMGMQKQVLTSVSGYSSVFSDENAIDAILMSYAGIRNKRIVEACQKLNVNAVGLSGIDGGMVQGKRNKGIRVRENGKTLIKRDFSGKPVQINSELLSLLLDNGYNPVLCIPIADENGFAINSENDDIVTCLAAATNPECIFQFIEAPGFMDDPADESSLVKTLSGSELAAREEQVEGRMKRKMLALRKLYEQGGARVVIADGRVEHPLADALSGAGTVIS